MFIAALVQLIVRSIYLWHTVRVQAALFSSTYAPLRKGGAKLGIIRTLHYGVLNNTIKSSLRQFGDDKLCYCETMPIVKQYLLLNNGYYYQKYWVLLSRTIVLSGTTVIVINNTGPLWRKYALWRKYGLLWRKYALWRNFWLITYCQKNNRLLSF